MTNYSNLTAAYDAWTIDGTGSKWDFYAVALDLFNARKITQKALAANFNISLGVVRMRFNDLRSM